MSYFGVWRLELVSSLSKKTITVVSETMSQKMLSSKK